MREVPPFERALVGVFIGVVVLLCMHAAGGCAHHQASLAPPGELRIASHPSSASPSRANTGIPPSGTRAVGAELVAIHESRSPGSLPRDVGNASRGLVTGAQAEAGAGHRQSAPGGSPGTLTPTGSWPSNHARSDQRDEPVGGPQHSRRHGAGGSTSRPGPDVAPTAANVSLRSAAVGAHLLAARACWLEGGWSLSDCAAIVYVLKARARRSGATLASMTLAYSALDADTPRAAFARQLPASDEPTFSARENERWAVVRAVARAALDGRVRNPAPGARHWGARNLPADVRRAERAVQSGRWRSIESDTRNAFFAVRGR